MDILIDYLAFTSKVHSVATLREVLGLKDVNFVEGKPRNGWLFCLYACGLRVFYGGREDVGIEMSGSGCRFLETCNDNSFDWLALFDFFLSPENGVNVSRLDVACDEKEGILKMKTLVRHTKTGRYISKARTCRWIDGAEQTIIFGASSSDTRLRIYNKALERKADGHWIRAEMQLRDGAADSFLLNLKQQRDIGKTYAGVLNNYLRFIKEAPEDSNFNYDRATVCKWWIRFVGTSERLKNITVGGMEYNLDSLKDYIKVQCSSSLKAFILVNGGDLSSLFEFIDASQLNKKQKMLLSSLQISESTN